MIGTRPTGAAIALAFVFALAPTSGPPLLAQTSGSATLSGSVRDATGAVVPGASLTLRNEGTQTTRAAASDAVGGFVFAAVTPGLYTLRVEMAGFAPYEATGLRLSPNDALGLDPTLAAAGQKEKVSVTAPREMLQTQTGAREGLITASEIENLSIISRSSMELLRILPGVVAPSLNQMEAVSFNQTATSNLSAWSVNGLRGTDSLSPVIDGSKVLDFVGNYSLMLTPNPDMVEEVKVQTSSFAAEYGSAGVQLTAVTKGGSRSFHGAAYDYWRSSQLAANDHSNNQAGLPKPKSSYNYPGFNLSGPLLVPGTGFNKGRDRLFFFVGFEYQDQTPDPGTWLGVVPTLRQREGDFSELLANRGLNLNQPPTVTIPGGLPGTGSPAPNNDLRPYLDPVGKALMSLYPLPNYEDPDNRYNYAFHVTSPLDRWQLVTRLDWNASARTHAYLRLAYEKETVDWPRGIANTSFFELPSHAVGDNRAGSASLVVTTAVSGSLTNEMVVSATRLKEDGDWKDPAKVTRAGLGIEDFRGLYPSSSPYPPWIIAIGQWQGWDSMLWSYAGTPVSTRNESLSIADSLTKVLQAHTLKAGVFVERGGTDQRPTTWQDGSMYLGSTMIPWGTGNDFGDLIVGRPFMFQQTSSATPGRFRFWDVEGYVQDSWKARRNLTLEAGVRLAWMPNSVETQGLGILFAPARYDRSQGMYIDGDPTRPNGVLWAKRGEIPKGMTPDPPLKAMPRLGFSWDVRGSGELVLRGGAGFFFNRPSGFAYSAITQPPNMSNGTVFAWAVPGGLTLAGLKDIDPSTSPGATQLVSLDPASSDPPRTWSWSLAVAKRLPWRQTIEVAYVGNEASHLPSQTPVDHIQPGTLTGTVGNADLDNPLHRAALDAGVANSFRPYPAYSYVGLDQFRGFSNYHALQATLSRPAGRRVQYLLAYTFSKALGTRGNDWSNTDPIDPNNRSYGVLDQDRTHLFNASYNVLLPDPIPPAGNGVLKALLNGWQVSGITSFASGAPLFFRFGGEVATDPVVRAWMGTDDYTHYWGYAGTGAIAPVYLRDPRTGKTGAGEKLADIGALAFPAFGTSGPYVQPWYVKSPPRWNWDLTVFKNFGLGGEKKLQLRVGFFNLFNQSWADPSQGDIDLDLGTVCNVHVNGVPNGAGGTSDYVCDATQGMSFTPQALQSFGTIKTRRGRRVVELALKFVF